MLGTETSLVLLSRQKCHNTGFKWYSRCLVCVRPLQVNPDLLIPNIHNFHLKGVTVSTETVLSPKQFHELEPCTEEFLP